MKMLNSAQSATRKATQSVVRMGKRIESVGNSLNSFAGSAKTAGATLTASLTAPIAAFGGAAFAAAMKLEQLERGLTAVTGSATAAQQQIARLREAAKLPGLGFAEAIRGSTRLQATGIEAELAERALKSFGNALATVGGGRVELDGVLLALTQIVGKGKVSAEEINQIAERVPQIRGAMIKAFGTANTELIQQAGLGANEFIDVIVSQMEALPRAASGTKNTLENLLDNVFVAMSKVGEPIIKIVAPAIDKVSKLVGDLGDAFAALPEEVQQVSFWIGAVAAAIGPLTLAAGAAFTLIGGAMTTIGTIVSTVGLPAIAMAAGALAQLTIVGTAIGTAVHFLIGPQGLFRIFQQGASTVQQFVVQAVGFFRNFRTNVARLTTWFKSNWFTIFREAGRFTGVVIGNVVKIIKSVIRAGIRLFSLFFGWFQTKVKQVFTVEFLIWVIKGLQKAQFLAFEFGKEFVQGIQDAINGNPLNTNDLFANLTKDLQQGVGTQDVFGDAARILKEEFSGVSGLTDGFVSELQGFPDFAEKAGNDGAKRLFAGVKKGIEREGKQVDLEARIAAKKLAEDVAKLTEELIVERDAFEKSSRETQIWKLAKRGATEETLKGLRAINKEIQALEERDRLIERGKQLTEQALSPQQKFLQTFDELNKLLATGNIGFDVYSRILAEANKEFNEAQEAAKIKVEFQVEGNEAVRAGTRQFRKLIEDTLKFNAAAKKDLTFEARAAVRSREFAEGIRGGVRGIIESDSPIEAVGRAVGATAAPGVELLLPFLQRIATATEETADKESEFDIRGSRISTETTVETVTF